eukprot:8175-Heterococcus_DN1.PRE.3
MRPCKHQNIAALSALSTALGGALYLMLRDCVSVASATVLSPNRACSILYSFAVSSRPVVVVVAAHT